MSHAKFNLHAPAFHQSLTFLFNLYHRNVKKTNRFHRKITFSKKANKREGECLPRHKIFRPFNIDFKFCYLSKYPASHLKRNKFIKFCCERNKPNNDGSSMTVVSCGHISRFNRYSLLKYSEKCFNEARSLK